MKCEGMCGAHLSRARINRIVRTYAVAVMLPQKKRYHAITRNMGPGKPDQSEGPVGIRANAVVPFLLVWGTAENDTTLSFNEM